jgi:hypothetical protein
VDESRVCKNGGNRVGTIRDSMTPNRIQVRRHAKSHRVSRGRGCAVSGNGKKNESLGGGREPFVRCGARCKRLWRCSLNHASGDRKKPGRHECRSFSPFVEPRLYLSLVHMCTRLFKNKSPFSAINLRVLAKICWARSTCVSSFV